MPSEKAVKHYFVDEAGDLTLFDKRKRAIVGKEGVSRCFMVGLVDLPDPDEVHRKLEELRKELLADPCFRGVPSMQPKANKTASQFHAKDDPPEVRRDVFQLLSSLDAKVLVVVKRKECLAKHCKDLHEKPGEKFNPDTVYDELIKINFYNKLHSADENRIVFARRGKHKREQALRKALVETKREFDEKWGKRPDPPNTVGSAYPSESAGLQVADYYLWAIQRMYERDEDRFFRLLEPQYRLIRDLDDTRNKEYGEYYNDKNKLTLEKMLPVTS